MLLAAALISVGVYFFLRGEAATDGTMLAPAEPAVAASPSTDGDANATSPSAAPTSPPATELIPSNE